MTLRSHKRLSMMVDVFKKFQSDSGKEFSIQEKTTEQQKIDVKTATNNMMRTNSGLKISPYIPLIMFKALNQSLDYLCTNHPNFFVQSFVYELNPSQIGLLLQTITKSREGNIQQTWWEKFNEFPSGIIHFITYILQPETTENIFPILPLSSPSSSPHSSHSSFSQSSPQFSSLLSSNNSSNLSSQYKRNSLLSSSIIELFLSSKKIWWDLDATSAEFHRILHGEITKTNLDYFLHYEEIFFFEKICSFLNYFCEIQKNIQNKIFTKNFKSLNELIDLFVRPLTSKTNLKKDLQKRKEFLRLAIFSSHYFFPDSYNSLPFISNQIGGELISSLSNEFYLEQILGTSCLLQLLEYEIDRIQEINNEGQILILFDDLKKLRKNISQINLNSTKQHWKSTYKSIFDQLFNINEIISDLSSSFDLSNDEKISLENDQKISLQKYLKLKKQERKEIVNEMVQSMKNNLKKSLTYTEIARKWSLGVGDSFNIRRINSLANIPPSAISSSYFVNFDIHDILLVISHSLHQISLLNNNDHNDNENNENNNNNNNNNDNSEKNCDKNNAKNVLNNFLLQKISLVEKNDKKKGDEDVQIDEKNDDKNNDLINNEKEKIISKIAIKITENNLKNKQDDHQKFDENKDEDEDGDDGEDFSDSEEDDVIIFDPVIQGKSIILVNEDDIDDAYDDGDDQDHFDDDDNDDDDDDDD